MSTTPLTQARRVLTDHDLPARLLPDNVIAATWDETTRVLTATLAQPVRDRFDGIPVRYAERVRAVVQTGHIPELTGVEARFALWLKVRAIRRDGEQLEFAVGRLSKRLPLAAFR